ncbi:hypothetical protein TVAG_013580 [Trichomonas vaginalis G3]|uniref:DUF6602 domain-containing protein n=1 Tax=Trichomonas vaginalis (strain ATCC PRA-98 / G3) TaxID=412133 RepID=A2DDB4_TRIV3|nr:SLL0572 protein family [Trichomonas vaginalis G3]EAY21593.1 hypothetical protein TVAG_013580 [Trichomonas vaginalis G3]KAI5489731.1 SLL0572 protein family [Trichomonas vaginalis G3]|eukprot:XP_001582579.1 hypothetical protein [Trichomonas vaginalis G3]
MQIDITRVKTLIVGCDFPNFYTYVHIFSKRQDIDVCGIIYAFEDEIPAKCYVMRNMNSIPIFPLVDLEKIIIEQRIEKCIVNTNGILMRRVQGIVNRILSTNYCSIEFVDPDDIKLEAHKPLISISSLAPSVGKTQICQYFCDLFKKGGQKVAVILPRYLFEPGEENITLQTGFHYEFKTNDEVPNGLLPKDLENQVIQYQKSGAFYIIVTTHIQRALISAEQLADVILFDTNGSSIPQVYEDYKFCILTEDSLMSPKNISIWPGLVNTFDSSHIITITDLENPKELQIEHLLPSKIISRSFFYVNSVTLPAAPPPCTGPERAVSPGSALCIGKTKEIQKQLSNLADFSNVIINSQFLHSQRDPSIESHIINSARHITDIDNAIFKWIYRTFQSSKKPPLQKHFESTVDILLSMVTASANEMTVTNNDSHNRGAFAKLFLQSHIPPGFHVTSGEIFDSLNNTTGQLSIVITNDESPSLTIDSSLNVITPILADSVLAVVEVKSNLNVESLKKALSQLRPVKALMPAHETIQNIDGSIIRDPLGGKIITGVFAYSISGDVEAKLGEIVNLYPHVADFIVLPDSLAYFDAMTLEICGIGANEKEKVGGYVKFTQKGLGLALIFGVLNSIAAMRQFSASNYIRYLGGSWGGLQEAFEREANELANSWNKGRHLLSNEIDQNKRQEILDEQSSFLNFLNNFQNK